MYEIIDYIRDRSKIKNLYPMYENLGIKYILHYKDIVKREDNIDSNYQNVIIEILTRIKEKKEIINDSKDWLYFYKEYKNMGLVKVEIHRLNYNLKGDRLEVVENSPLRIRELLENFKGYGFTNWMVEDGMYEGEYVTLEEMYSIICIERIKEFDKHEISYLYSVDALLHKLEKENIDINNIKIWGKKLPIEETIEHIVEILFQDIRKEETERLKQ